VYLFVCLCVCLSWFGQAVIKWAIMDGFRISRCLKKCVNVPVKMVLSQVVPLASMVVKNWTKNKFLRIFLGKNISHGNGCSSFICEYIFNIKVVYDSKDTYLSAGGLEIIPYYSLYITFLPFKSNNFHHEWLAVKFVCFHSKLHA